MKLNRTWAMVAAIVMALTLSLSGTLAYLQDTDEDVNVMTLGNVQIEQLEYERKVDNNGNYISTGEKDQWGYTPDELQEFTPGKPLYPAVYQGENAPWDTRDAEGQSDYQQSWAEIGAPGSNELWTNGYGIENVVDKFVFVKNTGKSDAYYRTIIAVESPETDSETAVLHLNATGNSRFDWDSTTDGTQKFDSARKFYVTINGVRYNVYEVIYTEILTPGETSRPSFLQVYLDKKATNEDCALYGDTLEILVVSQAVQVAGFADAQTALEEAFDPISETNHPWLEGDGIIRVANQAEFEAAVGNAKAGDTILMADGEYTLNGNMKEGVSYIGSGDTVISNPTGRALTGNLKDVTIANMTIDGSDGLRYCYAYGTVVLDNCVIEGDTYGIHFDGGSGNVIIRNSQIKGWNSFGRALESVTFENCDFSKSNYGCVRFYQNATMTDCTFSSDFSWIDSGCDNITIKLIDCEYQNGSLYDLVFNNGEWENVKWQVNGVWYTNVSTH